MMSFRVIEFILACIGGASVACSVIMGAVLFIASKKPMVNSNEGERNESETCEPCLSKLR